MLLVFWLLFYFCLKIKKKPKLVYALVHALVYAMHLLALDLFSIKFIENDILLNKILVKYLRNT